MKLIFLDIDGVLNHQLFYEKYYKDGKNNTGVEHPLDDLDPSRIEFLNQLIADTDAKVVISSTWRRYHTVEQLQGYLEARGFKGEIIGLTPVLNIGGHSPGKDSYTPSIPRGVEIYCYLKDNQEENRSYIILDDDSDMMLWQRSNYFHVDGYCGLTPNVVYKATNYLNKVSHI
jgi:hypothetical protein